MRKAPVKQLSLFESTEQDARTVAPAGTPGVSVAAAPDHHHTKVWYYGGETALFCSAQPTRTYRQDEYSAQFVGGVPAGEYCPICSPGIEAMRAWLLKWGKAHNYPGFGFPFVYPPKSTDKDRRFGGIDDGYQNWKSELEHHSQREYYPGEWLVKCIEHVKRFDSGEYEIPNWDSSAALADDKE